MPESAVVAAQRITWQDRLRAHVAIARPDHISKNVFVIPGVVIPLSLQNGDIPPHLVFHLIAGFLAVCLVACSNFVINENLDAPYDRFHHVKSKRRVPEGRVNIPLAYAKWLIMFGLGIGI